MGWRLLPQIPALPLRRVVAEAGWPRGGGRAHLAPRLPSRQVPVGWAAWSLPLPPPAWGRLPPLPAGHLPLPKRLRQPGLRPRGRGDTHSPVRGRGGWVAEPWGGSAGGCLSLQISLRCHLKAVAEGAGSVSGKACSYDGVAAAWRSPDGADCSCCGSPAGCGGRRRRRLAANGGKWTPLVGFEPFRGMPAPSGA